MAQGGAGGIELRVAGARDFSQEAWMRLGEIAPESGERAKRACIGFLAMVALLAFAGAMAAEKPKTETVQFKSGDQTVSAFLALPGQSGKRPAMIVIHESSGLND